MSKWSNYVEVASVHANDGYDWEAFGVFVRRSDNRLFFIIDMGEEDMTPFEGATKALELLGDMHRFITAGRGWARQAYGNTADNLAAFNELLLKVSDRMDSGWLAKVENARVSATEANNALDGLLSERKALEARIANARVTLVEARRALAKLED